MSRSWRARVSSNHKAFVLAIFKSLISDYLTLDLSFCLDSLFDAEPEAPVTETVITISDYELKLRGQGRVTVGFTLPDGSFNISSMFAFKPAMEKACTGHVNVLDGSTIHLAAGCEKKDVSMLISAATVNGQLSEVCTWRLNADELVLGK